LRCVYSTPQTSPFHIILLLFSSSSHSLFSLLQELTTGWSPITPLKAMPMMQAGMGITALLLAPYLSLIGTAV
jgi:hypothetical protein